MRTLTRLGTLAIPAVVGLAAAWLALLAFGTDTARMGPFDVHLSARVGSGRTVIDLPPLGTIAADTHTAPVGLTASVADVNVAALTELLDDGTLGDVVASVERDARARIGPFALRTLAVALGGALVGGAAVFRLDRRRVGVAVLTATVVAAAGGASAWATFRPDAFREPSFDGALTLAPQLVGPVDEVTDRIEGFRRELGRIVSGAVRAYAKIDPVGAEATDGIRVLHISDIHLSPLGLDLALELARGFDVDLVVDTGDLSSFGTAPEQLLLSSVERFDRPYVFVRGNHDSRDVQDAIGEVPGVTVLDGSTTEVAGLTIYGLGHPVFTADRSAPVEQDRFVERARAAGTRVADDIAGRDVDVVAVHDDRMAEAVAGSVPLVISGHRHRTSMRVEAGTTYLRVGTTGGGGFDVFTERGGIPLEAQILTFAAGEPPRLVAIDRVWQSPETGRLVVERNLHTGAEASPAPVLTPRPSPA